MGEGAGAGGEEAVIPQGSESLMMHCAKPSVYFSNYGFLCSPTSLCFTVSLGMKSEFQNSHNCPKETMKHLYIPWLEFKIICKVSSHPLSPCTSCTMRKWPDSSVFPEYLGTATHHFLYHHFKCPSPVPCMAQCLLPVLTGPAQIPTPSRRFPQARIYFSPSLGQTEWPKRMYCLCVSFRSLFNSVVLFMLFIHFAKCVYEKGPVTYSYMALQNLASTQYLVDSQSRLNA